MVASEPRPDPSEVSLPRASKGKRPHFFDDPAVDQLMTFLLELMAETAALRDRVDTIERLLDAQGSITRADIEGYHADTLVEGERTAWRKGFIERVLRMHAPS